MADEIVYGWKGIAAVLECTERTAQRYADSHGLPVKCLGTSKHSRVLAFVVELHAWKAKKFAVVPRPVSS